MNQIINLLRQPNQMATGALQALSNQYLYNPQTQKLFPQSMMHNAPALNAPTQELAQYGGGLAMAGITGGVQPKFNDWDEAVKIVRGGAKYSLEDNQAAMDTILREAKRQLTPKELIKNRGNFEKMVKMVQKRIADELKNKIDIPRLLNL